MADPIQYPSAWYDQRWRQAIGQGSAAGGVNQSAVSNYIAAGRMGEIEAAYKGEQDRRRLALAESAQANQDANSKRSLDIQEEGVKASERNSMMSAAGTVAGMVGPDVFKEGIKPAVKYGWDKAFGPNTGTVGNTAGTTLDPAYGTSAALGASQAAATGGEVGTVGEMAGTTMDPAFGGSAVGSETASTGGGMLGMAGTIAGYYGLAKAGGMLAGQIDKKDKAGFGSLNQPLNVERYWAKKIGIDKGPVNTVLDILNPLAPVERAVGTVLCTELHRQGKLPDDIYMADSEYGRTMVDLPTLVGYHSWGVPLASLMSRSKVVTFIVAPVVKAWAQESAYRMGVVEKGSMLGRCIDRVGVPLCRMLGKTIMSVARFEEGI